MSDRAHWCGCREGGLHYYSCGLVGFVHPTRTRPPTPRPTGGETTDDESNERGSGHE